MFDVDWLGEDEPPKKPRRKRRTKAEMEAARAVYTPPKRRPPPKRKRKLKLPPSQREMDKHKHGGGRYNTANSPESHVKAGQTHKANAWRRHSPNKGSAPLQSAQGFSDCVVSIHGGGRVMPKFIREDWDG